MKIGLARFVACALSASTAWCAPQASRAVDPASGPKDAIAVDLLLDSGFEMVADSTTDPKKYGAYWEGAFAPKECDPRCRVIELDDGNHVLRLRAGEPRVDQLLTLLGPYSNRFTVELRVRPRTNDAKLVVTFESEGGRDLAYLLGASERVGGSLVAERIGEDPSGFVSYRLRIGRDFEDLAGEAPPSWGRIALSCIGGEVDVDDVVGAHFLPRVSHAELRTMLLDDVRDVLSIHLDPASGGAGGNGLGIVDPETGYQVVSGYDVESGEKLGREYVLGIRGIHEAMLRYARIPRAAGDDDALLPRVRETLRRFALSLMKNNVYAPTGLFCLYDVGKKAPVLSAELSPTHFITTVLSIADLFPDDKSLHNYAHFYAGKMADAMVKLRREHDLPKNVPYGRGAGGNWFGRMPEKVSPQGVLAPPKRSTYDQSWAIAFDRSWYHDFDTSVGLMRVWRDDPKPEYLDAIRIACAKFDRGFDATRYDLENDTDDHYGRNTETALEAYRYSDGAAKELLDFTQRATDLRLDRSVPYGETVWLQGIRLGSFTTGDQPRAFPGPVGLHNLPVELNPLTSRFEPYSKTLREFAKADLRRRLLDDGYYTEASSWQWHMIAACFIGNYIGPCSEGRAWEGDMGDLFAGPPANAFRALLRTIEIDRPGRDAEWIAWYAALHGEVLAKYRAKYGYRFGMNRETGIRYGIPVNKLGGFETRNPLWFAITLLHTELLETGCLDRAPGHVSIESVKRNPDGKSFTLALAGPAGREIDVFAAPSSRFEDASENDWRLRHVSRCGSFAHAASKLDATGHATIALPFDDVATLAIDVELPLLDGAGLEDLAGGVFTVEN